jgi:hypothetical protein
LHSTVFAELPLVNSTDAKKYSLPKEKQLYSCWVYRIESIVGNSLRNVIISLWQWIPITVCHWRPGASFTFSGKAAYLLLWTGQQATHKKCISGIHNHLNYGVVFLKTYTSL